MADTAILRIVNPNNLATVRLNLQAGAYRLADGFDEGSPGLRRVLLSQPGYDGEEQAATSRTNATMTIPVTIVPQDTWAAVQAAYDALYTEMDRDENTIEWRPIGAGASRFYDVLRVEDPPPLFRQEHRRPDCVLYAGELTIKWLRLPWHR